MRGAFVASLALVALVGSAESAPSQELTGDAEARSAIEVRDLRRTAEGISGVAVNRGRLELRKIRILVQLLYHWPDEMHPGPVSPSDATIVTIEGPVSPGEAAPFVGTLPTRPDVAAGPTRPEESAFELRAAVLGWSEVGVP